MILPRCGYAQTPAGPVHYARLGVGEPVLCIHQTPRSWDEFREVQALLSASFDVVAMDLPGMGASPSAGAASIESFADAALGLVQALSLDRVRVIGHHTGGVVALRLAAIAGERVERLVLSSTPYVDAEARHARATQPAIDAVDKRDDGSHLQLMWDRRAAFYPPDRPDLRARYVLDALRAEDAEAGHEAVARYHMERDIGRVTQPALVVRHNADPYAAPQAVRLQAVLACAPVLEIDHGMVPLEYAASAFAEAVAPFLKGA
jgi:pimeloyl-ACP methyl ester carboxylesterase